MENAAKRLHESESTSTTDVMPDMDAVFRALGDPGRRRLLDRLNERNGLTLTELCEGMGMTRQSVTKHLTVLEAAGLVTTLRQGREKLHYLNAAPINDIADRWMHSYDRTRAAALSDLKTALEATTPMDTTEHTTHGSTFVYSTYIQATPERVWQGLTDPEFTTRYWRHPKSGGITMTSDWKKGSAYDVAYGEHAAGDPRRRAGRAGVRPLPPAVLHLAYVHARVGRGARCRAGSRPPAGRAEARSKVAFDIEEFSPGVVKLTVVHDSEVPGSVVVEGAAQGWPAVLASLKTLLETGAPLPA